MKTLKIWILKRKLKALLLKYGAEQFSVGKQKIHYSQITLNQLSNLIEETKSELYDLTNRITFRTININS